MHVAVIEPDGGIRCILCAFLVEDGYEAKDYTEIPLDYDKVNVVIFGPGMTVPQDQLDRLDKQHIPYLQLDYFSDMDKVMEDVAKFAHTEQSLLEDRAV